MGASKSKRSQRSPRRKAGSSPARGVKRPVRFRLVVEAQEMIVEYVPDWTGGEFAQAKFEFRSPRKPARRIAISETGYRCQFAAMEEVKALGGPEQYARAYVLSVLDAGRKPRVAGGVQLSLF